MATQRYVSTSFWTDPWVSDDLTSDERYLYLYLITGPQTNIAGVYELSMKVAEAHTGFDREQILRIMSRFAEAGKAYYHERYVVIPSWPKHQRWDARKNINDGIQKILRDLPDSVWAFLQTVNYEYPIADVGRDLAIESLGSTVVEPPSNPRSTGEESHYMDTDIDMDINSIAAEAAHKPPERPSKLHDPIADSFEEAFWTITGEPASFGKERKACVNLARVVRSRSPDDPQEFARVIANRYVELTKSGAKFWKEQPLTASSLLAHFDRVVKILQDEWEDRKTAEDIGEVCFDSR